MLNETELEYGITLWQSIVDAQNRYIVDLGNIPKHHTLYQRFLNKWQINEWRAIVIAIEEILEIRPDLFQEYHIYTIEKIKELIRNNQSIQSNKKLQWKMIMIMREIWNALNNIDISVKVVLTKGTPT